MVGFRRVVFFLLALSLFLLPAGAAAAQGLQLEAKGAVLMDAASGKVLFYKNMHEKMYPASMTKIMTLILAEEAVQEGRVSLKDTVVTSERAASLGGSQVWLEPGEKFTLKEMLTAIAVGSANDCCVAVAEHIAGTEEAFVEMMNKKAKEIGCKNTHFVNTHGLHDDNHYTTPYDMALISRYALRYPNILKLTSIKEYTFRDIVLYNTNKNLWWYPGTDGLKTGTTSQAGRNLASTVERNDLRLISVVMGADRSNRHFSESMKLFNWGFANYVFKKYYDAGEEIRVIKVGKGTVDSVSVTAARDVGVTVKRGEEDNLSLDLNLPALVQAPLQKGQRAGEAVITIDGKAIEKIDLIAAQEVSRCSLWQEIKRVITGILAF